MASDLAFLHCLTPLHNGCGQGLGVIDRPVIRESTTGHPFIQGSTLKGALRAMARGPATEEAALTASPAYRDAFGTVDAMGLFHPSDAMLVLLPVRSLRGVFCWVTCPLALARLARLADIAGVASTISQRARTLLAAGGSLGEGEAFGCGTPSSGPATANASSPDAAIAMGASYVVEGMVLKSVQDQKTRAAVRELATGFAEILVPSSAPKHKDEHAWFNGFLGSRLLLTSDQSFTTLATHALPVEANIAIGEGGVTTTGSLRYTEFLPADSVLVSLLRFDLSRGSTSESEIRSAAGVSPGTWITLQVGADESKGKGLVRWAVSEAPKSGSGDADRSGVP